MQPTLKKNLQKSMTTIATWPTPRLSGKFSSGMAKGKSGVSFTLQCVVVIGELSRVSFLDDNSSSQAYKAVGESAEIPLAYYANNVSATVSLLQIMSEYDCTRLVYSSSATVYGTPPRIPIPETTRLQADSPYGKTKVMCEMIIDDLCNGVL
jgi:hypothetical protein